MSSCRKLYQLHARNATTIIHFIVTAKIVMDTKSINAVSASVNSHLINPRRSRCENIHPVPVVEKLRFFIMTTNSIQIIVVVTRNVTTQCLYQNQQP